MNHTIPIIDTLNLLNKVENKALREEVNPIYFSKSKMVTSIDLTI